MLEEALGCGALAVGMGMIALVSGGMLGFGMIALVSGGMSGCASLATEYYGTISSGLAWGKLLSGINRISQRAGGPTSPPETAR